MYSSCLCRLIYNVNTYLDIYQFLFMVTRVVLLDWFVLLLLTFLCVVPAWEKIAICVMKLGLNDDNGVVSIIMSCCRQESVHHKINERHLSIRSSFIKW